MLIVKLAILERVFYPQKMVASTAFATRFGGSVCPEIPWSVCPETVGQLAPKWCGLIHHNLHSWVHFYNFRYFDGASGHDFNFQTTLRNTSRPEQSSCRKVTVEIVGTENEISIPLSDKGCIATLNLSLGNETIYGKDHDLSIFGCDFNSFQHLSCNIQNGHIKISLNNKVVY
jgi:hypothetical protein